MSFCYFILCVLSIIIIYAKFFDMNNDEEPGGITFLEFMGNNYDYEKKKLKNVLETINKMNFINKMKSFVSQETWLISS